MNITGMNERNALQRRFRVAQRGLTKAFSFKHKNHVGRAAHIKRWRSMGDETSTISNSVIIVPSVQRLTASSPPLAMLESIHGPKSLSARRSIKSSKRLAIFSSAPLMIQATVTSPNGSKKTQKRISATLKNDHCKSDEKYYSAWERRQPSSLNKNDHPYRTRQNTIAEESRKVDITITDSSNSEFLPPNISPAYKFVPIGHEEDDDDNSFASGDNDICTLSGNECDHQHERVDNISIHGYSDDVIHDKYSVVLENEFGSTMDCLPPSPLSTENTSSRSRESYVSVREGRQKQRCHIDKPCDQNNKDWFPHVKQEIMKLASCFTQCGATSKSTI